VNLGFSRNKLKYSVNEKFFSKWDSQVAYLLGFTYADGNLYKTSLSWDIQVGDIEFLKRVRKVLKCTYPVALAHNGLSCRLRINNQVFINRMIKLGLFPKKLFRYHIPKIPSNFIRHFIRGYLDGDGWIIIRKNRNEIDLGFAGATKEFLESINELVIQSLNINVGKVRMKNKVTLKNIKSVTYQLEYYSSNAFKIANWIYQDLDEIDLFLKRKYKTYLQAQKLHQFLSSGIGKTRAIQRSRGESIEQTLRSLFVDEKLNGVEIAKILNVHSSWVYRWLARVGIKYPIKRITHG